MLSRLALPLMLLLGACQTDNPTGWNSRDANYDALKRASDDCAAHGGTLVLRDGRDEKLLSSYECKGAKAN
jgi:hypothetical protein